MVCSFVKFSDVYRSDMVVDMGYVFWIIYFVYSGEAYGGYVRYRNLIGGLMWGGWERNKVLLFIIDLYTGPEKDRMRIREMKKIGLWREETTRDVTKYSECTGCMGKLF